MAENQSYILAETLEERIAIAMLNVFDIWSRENHGEGELPSIAFCRRHILPFILKEVLVSAYGETNLREEIITKRQQTLAHGIMLANAAIQKELLPEYS